MQQNNEPHKIAVIGGGSWATAIVKILSENNVAIRWWLRSQEDVLHIRQLHRNPRYLSSVEINPNKVTPMSNLREAVHQSDFVLLAVPSAFVIEALRTLRPEDFEGKTIVSAVKGMIPDENLVITKFLEKKYNVTEDRLLVVAGPCHAEEVAMERQSYLTISGATHESAKLFASLINGRFVKASTNADLYGVQYCAAHKNVVALACGIARGLNYGDNFQSVMVANAMQEARRFLDASNPLANRELDASAYLGDLLVTAYSQFSRNRTFGYMIGRGYSVKSAQMEMNMIAEGYYAVKCLYELNKLKMVDMPLVKATYNILYERISPVVEFKILKEKMS